MPARRRGCRRRGIRHGLRPRDTEPAGEDEPLLHGVRDEEQQALGDELREQQPGAQDDDEGVHQRPVGDEDRGDEGGVPRCGGATTAPEDEPAVGREVDVALMARAPTTDTARMPVSACSRNSRAASMNAASATTPRTAAAARRPGPSRAPRGSATRRCRRGRWWRSPRSSIGKPAARGPQQQRSARTRSGRRRRPAASRASAAG